MKKLLLFVLFLLSSHIALAQENLEVTVYDLSNQAPLDGIKVILENSLIGYKAQKSTNAQGKVTFSALSTSGSYAVSVEETEKYFATRAENILIRSNKN